MSPPKDPPSGKFRRDVPHVDHAHRDVTRPGPHVEDFADEPTPIREFHRLEQRVANVEANALETRLRLEQADSLPSTEWAKGIDARIGLVADDAKAGGDVARGLRRIKALAWGALGTAITGLGAALWFALGVAKASGVSEGVAREREIQRLKDAARLDAVEAAQGNLSRELSRILGILDGARPYRAAPYLGPPPPDPEP